MMKSRLTNLSWDFNYLINNPGSNNWEGLSSLGENIDSVNKLI